MLDPIKIYRLSHLFHGKKFHLVARILRDINFFLFKTYLPPSCQIGVGSLLGYKGMGTVIHTSSVIGKNCVIGHGVTLGTAMPYSSNQPSLGPRVGDNTFIGSGAKILGNIEVGSNCTIAAGAIVLKNIPNNSIAVGVPARIIGINNSAYQAIVRISK